MKILKKALTLLCVLGITTSLACTPPAFVPKDNFPELNIEEQVAKKFNLRVDKMKKYLETIHKMDKPVPIIMVREGKTKTFDWDGSIPEGGVVVGYLVKEHNKLAARIEHGNLMGDTAELLTQYIQIEVEMYNLLIDYAQLQHDLAKQYRAMWIDAENRRLVAEHELKIQRWEHKLTIVGGILGIIAIFAL